MAFDFKKEYREFYLPKDTPSLVDIPPMNYLAVWGDGDPNTEDGAYKKAIEQLYGVAYTIKMSHKTSHKIEGFFAYVVPPLEGFWWQDGGTDGIDYGRKDQLHFIAVIRLPDFVTSEDVSWAVAEAARKKKKDFGDVKFWSYSEGLCVQCLHVGPYDTEPATTARMRQFMEEQGCSLDISETRLHHEIYLGDPRKTAPDKLKTVLRHPVRRRDSISGPRRSRG